MHATFTDSPLPMDILGRDTVIARILDIVKLVSDNRLSYSFALNGAWGTGKTFVLNRLVKELLDYEDGGKYFVFHYNCWQYDYYEEPLTAIVAAMWDSVDEENRLFSRDLRDKAKKGMAAARPVLESIAKNFFLQKCGIDIADILSLVRSGTEGLEDAVEKAAERADYDRYYAFKKAITAAREELRKLTAERTLVVIVDELDRCLPEYAIKVLERLHHLFDGLDNCAIILAVDKSQLDASVKQIFGARNDATDRYLKKFINFEVQLDVGRINGSFAEKYADVFALFDASLIGGDFAIDTYFSALFHGIDARTFFFST